MKTIIAKEYLKRAHSLRVEYFDNLRKIVDKEEIVNKHKSNLEYLVNNLDNLIKKADKSVDIREVINEKLVDIEKNVVNIQNEIKPFYERIEDIRKEGDILYNSIAEKYPDLTNNELKEQIVEYISQFEKKD